MTYRSRLARRYFWFSITGIAAWSIQIYFAGVETNYAMGAVGGIGLIFCAWCARTNWEVWHET